MLGKTWHYIDVSGNDRHILLVYKCHFCHLLPFAKVGQIYLSIYKFLRMSVYMLLHIWRACMQKLLNPLSIKIDLSPIKISTSSVSTYTGWPKNNGTVDFSGFCSNQQLSFFTLLDRASFLRYNNTKIIKFGWKLFILWVFSDGLSFSGFAIKFSLVDGPPKNGIVDFLGLCSDQQLSFFTCLYRASFPHYNNTKILKFGWKLFILWVISYGLSFSGCAINLSSCLETQGNRANPEDDSP